MLGTNRTKVCIIGAGAIGGFFGAQLAHGDADVSVVARGRTLEALRERGWVLERDGKRIAAPVRAVASGSELPVQDVVILAVKAYVLSSIAPMVKPLLGFDTIVVPAVNGVPWWFHKGLASVDPHGSINACIPVASVIGAVVYPACSSPEPGVTRHHSGSRVVLGEVRGEADTPRLRAFMTLLQSVGIGAETSNDIRTEVWMKLLGNACFNPVSFVTGSATDLMIDDPAIGALFIKLMDETLAVGHALGIHPAIRPADRIAITRKLGSVKTSMLQDAEARRPIELDAILGAVIELGASVGVPTPTSDTLHALARMRARTFGLLSH